MMSTFKNYVAQPSTWRGLAVLGAMAGFAPEASDLAQQSAQGVVAVIGLWELMRRGRTVKVGGLNA